MDASETYQVISGLAKSLKDKKVERKVGVLTEDTPNGKYLRTYNQSEVAAATNLIHRKVPEVCEELGIDYKDGKKFCVDINDLYKIREHVGYKPFSRRPDQKLIVMSVSSLKGGSGKTTSVVTLASGLATEFRNNYRVAVIDLDPQGTSTLLLNPKFSENDLSVGDLLLGSYRLGEGQTHEDVYRSAFHKTSIPNLFVLGARESDRDWEFEVRSQQILSNAGVKVDSDVASGNTFAKLERIIKAVESDYDIILIDSAPNFGELTIAGHYVSNSIIIPIKPSENDFDSTGKYLEYLGRMYKTLIGLGHTGYDSIRVLLTATRKASIAQNYIANLIRQAIGSEHMFVHDLYESEAVTTCAADFCTVFDQSPSEYSRSSGSLRTVQSDYLLQLTEVENDILKIWGEI